MGVNTSLRPKDKEGGGGNSAIRKGGNGPSNTVAKERKKRRWVTPKDKSVARKTFLKVRDAKARSQFSKLLKKAGEGGASPVDRPLPISTADENNAFLERIMDPFAHFKPEDRTSPDHPNSKGSMVEWGEATLRRSGDPSRTVGDTPEAARRIDLRRAPQNEAKHIHDRDDAHCEATVEKPKATKLATTKESKGYMPFIRARSAFEAKQREREAVRLAQKADAEKEMIRRREKKKLDKVAHKKLQARTTKGQPVMGNLVDFLLLKMQKKH